VVNSIRSFTAQVFEVSVTNGELKIHRIVCAVDCGHVVNPAIVVQQIESGIVYGLSAALKGAITFDKGRARRWQLRQLRRAQNQRNAAHRCAHRRNRQQPWRESAKRRFHRSRPRRQTPSSAATGKRLRKLPIDDLT
jgi:isoquinoline 1-oxidoreductase beta subunit